jgi:hypothetical protein
MPCPCDLLLQKCELSRTRFEKNRARLDRAPGSQSATVRAAVDRAARVRQAPAARRRRDQAQRLLRGLSAAPVRRRPPAYAT